MRSLPLLLGVAVLVLALGAGAPASGSNPFGRDILTVRLDATSSDHWVLLDTGRVHLDGHLAFAFLLGHQKERAPFRQYDAMKVVGGTGGRTLWTYDARGSNYVDARGAGDGPAVGDEAGFGAVPRFLDVDGDGTDDVVFVEYDFALGRQLRAVKIEP